MKIHKEGFATIIITAILLGIINIMFFQFIPFIIIPLVHLLASIVFFFIILYFFRVPNRKGVKNEKAVIAPADGTLVAIEEVLENEYFKDKRKQVSIFMSPLNVHINWVPVKGEISYYKYHHGKHLVAWHPKSSTDNERTTVVFKMEDGKEIMIRQIAGAVARRIVCYAKENERVNQGDQIGFIKFGSRVDIFLPIDASVDVGLNEKITGNRTIISNLF